MTLKKAIERLETFIERHPSAGYAELIPALKLLIEAGKQRQQDLLGNPLLDGELLPGETGD